MNQRILIAAVAILILIGGYFFYQNSQNQTSSTTKVDLSSPSSSPAESTSSSAAVAVKEFNVTGSSFKFDPAIITVNKGDLVKINFQNVGGTHSLVLDDFNVKTEVLSGGKSQSIQFTADKSGTFEYYCSVGNHRAMGMTGKLVVQ